MDSQFYKNTVQSGKTQEDPVKLRKRKVCIYQSTVDRWCVVFKTSYNVNVIVLLVGCANELFTNWILRPKHCCMFLLTSKATKQNTTTLQSSFLSTCCQSIVLERICEKDFLSSESNIVNQTNKYRNKTFHHFQKYLSFLQCFVTSRLYGVTFVFRERGKSHWQKGR